MNRELLARVRDRIAVVGNEHCDMMSWSRGRMAGNGEPECGTTACLAGHVLAMRYGSFDQYESKIGEPWQRAARLLGFPSDAPFFLSRWPEHYVDLARDEGDAKGMLAVCDALLDGALVFDDRYGLVEAAAGGGDG